MYEVFLNERRIILADAGDPDCPDSPVKAINPDDAGSVGLKVNQFLKGNDATLLLTGNPEWLWPVFRSLFIQIPAAGGVVKSEKGYLFIFRRGRWDLPKGKIDENETPGETAIREVQEETGLKSLILTGELPPTRHIYRSPYIKTKDRWILKETKWFMMSASGDQPLFPEKSEDIDEARWFVLPEFSIILDDTYPNLKRLINKLQKI